MLWLGDEHDSRLLSILATVAPDEAVEDCRCFAYDEFQQMVGEAFPGSKVQLFPIADKLIVRGQARTPEEAAQIMALVRKEAGNVFADDGSPYFATAAHVVAEPLPGTGSNPEPAVIDMLERPGVQQVKLKVRIAELKRSAVRELGTDFEVCAGDCFHDSLLSGGGNVLATGTFEKDFFNLALRLLEANAAARILAEPDLVVSSGETANVIAVAQCAVPPAVGLRAPPAAATESRGTGTQLTLTAVVVDKDRIRLDVAPTFGSLNSDGAVNGVLGQDASSARTTADLREGQVLAIAGLLREQHRGDVSRSPLLARIARWNVLVSNRNIARDETELIVLVTPEFVHAAAPEDAPSVLPGANETAPADLKFFFSGQGDEQPCGKEQSTAPANDRQKLQDGARCNDACYRISEEYYIHGPHGFSR
jgi:pilus assembly protein CpaC